MFPSSPSALTDDLQSGQATILCTYRNSTDRMVIVRARATAAFFLERVVFPFETMMFHCPQECEVEVVMRTPGGLEQSEWVAAEQLRASEHGSCSMADWRPARSARVWSVRSNASVISADPL
ncbi:MAG: DUF1830 domain-containing protein [Cyanobacteriota bacterium]